VTDEALNPPGRAMVQEFQDEILAQWREASRENNTNDLAALVYETEDEISIGVAPRAELSEQVRTDYPKLQTPAHEYPPLLPAGTALWVIVCMPESTEIMRLMDLTLSKRALA
jgi:hypothetical protein